MNILDSIFGDASARRRKRLSDLVAARVSLQASHDDAIASGADTDKPQARLDKHDAEIRAAQAAVDATEAAAEQQRKAAHLGARERAEHLAVVSFADFAREVVSAENAALASAAQWATAAQALEVAHDAERAAIGLGSPLRTISGRGVSLKQLFTRVYMRALRIVHDRTGMLLMYPSTTGTFEHESAADVLAREMATHPTSTRKEFP